ncbi:MAG TPA: AMP-binding protein [Bacteroidales bacterium]|nr:AMP-binding protein [Bacteroidales bacterium]
MPKLEKVYTVDKMTGIPNWMEVIEMGKLNRSKWESQLEVIKSTISPKDCASLIYTSGTTGTPKGVMLSHENLVQNFLVADMKEIRPHGFDAVPRILEKIYETIISRGKKLPGVKKKLFFWAVDLGLRYKIDEESSWFYKQKLKIADRLIFSKWRAAIGGLANSVGCGGAALPNDIERIFWAAGIKILNMYGLTETSPIITLNRGTRPLLKLGSVGCVIDGVQLKIAEDGEILCKGHNVMMGYYKNEELAKQSFTEDGWFKTGDIGHLIDDKFLMVTDRKKEIFKLSNGKYVAPQSVEIKYKNSIFIENLMVIGGT